MGNCIKSSKHNHAPLISGASDQQIRDFLTHVRPLDLLVFRGAELVSNTITKLEKIKTGSGAVSHVEVAITREWCSKIKAIKAETSVHDSNTTLFSWGSTLSGNLNDGAYNAETGGTTFGVQIRVLEDLVASYLKNPGANVGVCRLINNPILRRENESEYKYLHRAEELKQKIASAYEQYNGQQYDANPLALFGSMFPALRSVRDMTGDILSTWCEANKWLFCSEFVAVLYEAIGVITDETDGVCDGKLLNAADVLPVDFLGCDADRDGIVKPICEVPPIWVKKETDV